MATPAGPRESTSTPLPTIREEEQADEAKTADSAPAPVSTPRERKLLVRDAYGNNPYGNDPTGPDGVHGVGEVGEAPYERPDPRLDALRALKARTEDPRKA
jgi:hypothetical protein